MAKIKIKIKNEATAALWKHRHKSEFVEVVLIKTQIWHFCWTLTTGSREKPGPPDTKARVQSKTIKKMAGIETGRATGRTWYRERYSVHRQKNTRLCRRASNNVAARLRAAPARHSSSMAVWVSRPSQGPSHSRVGEDSSCSSRGFPL